MPACLAVWVVGEISHMQRVVVALVQVWITTVPVVHFKPSHGHTQWYPRRFSTVAVKLVVKSVR